MTETDLLEAIERKLRQNARSRYGVIPEDEREAFLNTVLLEVVVFFERVLSAKDANDAFEFAKRQLDDLCDGRVATFLEHLQRYANTQYITIAEAIREEFVQDVMLAIQRTVHGGGRVEHPKAAARIAFKNRCRSHLRREVHQKHFFEEAGYQLGVGEDVTNQAILMNEMSTIIEKAITRLPQKLRTAITLRFFNRLNIAEAANEVGIKVSAFKSRLKRGLDALRDKLQKESELNDGYFADDSSADKAF